LLVLLAAVTVFVTLTFRFAPLFAAAFTLLLLRWLLLR
jgi:hypothetical protein